MFVAGWRHALRSEWPFIIIMCKAHCKPGKSGKSSLQLTHCVVHLPFPPPPEGVFTIPPDGVAKYQEGSEKTVQKLCTLQQAE